MATPDRPFGRALSRPAQIVVAIPDLRLVLGRLEALGVRAQSAEKNEDLGLALVELASEGVKSWAVARRDTQEADDDKVLDALFDDLYTYFDHEFGHWVPTIGKNRSVDEVGGEHTIGVGDEGEPAEAGQLDARSAEAGAGVAVGVADTVLHRNEWLDGAYQVPWAGLWRDGVTVPRATVPEYQTGHATFVLGMILQKAPGAHAVVRQVLGNDGFADSWDVARALVRFERLGIDILNLSLGCFTGDNQPPLVLQTALNRLDPDIVVVAAAGNHARAAEKQRRPLWPAALPRAVAVGATDAERNVPEWSPEPKNWPWVNVLATGKDVTSTFINGRVELPKGSKDFKGFATWSGTSFAAAKVSGAVAAGTVPGRASAATALRELMARHRGDDGIPWIP